ncbi:MAG: histidine kinase, partial [Dehalococcoidia bacterium]|nr:histidine kinase [Dehalococcoidia bacterium]
MGYLVNQKVEARDRARLFASHALRSREQERLRVSRDLHDDTIQKLVMLCRQLDGVRYFSGPLPPAVSDELLAVRSSVEQVAGDLRVFARDLRPSALDEFGAVVSIKQQLS